MFWTTYETKGQCSFSPKHSCSASVVPVNRTTSWTCPKDLSKLNLEKKSEEREKHLFFLTKVIRKKTKYEFGLSSRS